MASRCRNGIMVSLLLCVVVLAGCAKRPAMTAASAPAPTPAPSTATPASRPPVQEFAANPNLKDIHFDFDKYDIRPGDAKILDGNASWLKSNDALVLIEGHCA